MLNDVFTRIGCIVAIVLENLVEMDSQSDVSLVFGSDDEMSVISFFLVTKVIVSSM